MIKVKKFIKVIKVTVLILFISISSYANKQFTHTATKENNYCNGTCTLLDVPELNNNPNAVILVTALKNNTQPITAYYIKTKKDVSQWSIINIDNSLMVPGTQYNVEYYLQPDDKHFVHVVTRDNNVINEGESKKKGSYIDHATLNNNPGAQIRYFQNWAPGLRGGLANRYDIKIEYDNLAGRWYMFNTNGRPLDNSTAYNIIIANDNTVTKLVNTNPVSKSPANTVSNQVSPSGPIKEMYMTVWANGIKVGGDNIKKGFLDKIQIWGFEMGGATPTDQRSAKRQYEPITVKNTMGAPSTIPLFDAFIKNQNLAITIETYSTSPSTGANEINYTIKLTGARVVSFKQIYDESPHLNLVNAKEFTNEMKITFTKIEFIKDGVVVEENL